VNDSPLQHKSLLQCNLTATYIIKLELIHLQQQQQQQQQQSVTSTLPCFTLAIPALPQKGWQLATATRRVSGVDSQCC
jgi:hypothetical protein